MDYLFIVWILLFIILTLLFIILTYRAVSLCDQTYVIYRKSPYWCTCGCYMTRYLMMNELSSYAKGLSEEAKERYKKKLEIINGLDPFNASTTGELPDCLAPLETVRHHFVLSATDQFYNSYAI